MLVTEKLTTGSTGKPLHLTIWEPDRGTRGVILLLHGFGEYAGRYGDWARRFTEHHLTVYMHDQQGHGRTPGKRGVAESYMSLLEDAAIVAHCAETAHPGLPVTLYGHSMGGNAALNLLLRRPEPQTAFRRAIASSPWLLQAKRYPPSALKHLEALAKIMPRFTLRTAPGLEALSHDMEWIGETLSDGLFHNQLGVRLLLEVLEAGEYAVEHAAEIQIPLLILQGGEDKLVSPKGAEAFMQNAGPNVLYKDYPTQYHELHNDDLRDEVFEDILRFIDG